VPTDRQFGMRTGGHRRRIRRRQER
jgi:hypothetical protein